MTTHSTAKIAADLAGDSMKDPEGWLLRRIRAGEIPALKVGRHYRMTDEHVAKAHEVLSNTKPSTDAEESSPQRANAAPKPLALTRTSARRLKAVGATS